MAMTTPGREGEQSPLWAGAHDPAIGRAELVETASQGAKSATFRARVFGTLIRFSTSTRPPLSISNRSPSSGGLSLGPAEAGHYKQMYHTAVADPLKRVTQNSCTKRVTTNRLSFLDKNYPSVHYTVSDHERGSVK